MKTLLSYLCLFVAITTLYSCGPRFNGNSENEFNNSKKKVEEKLNKDEKTNLEKAMRVTVMEAMRLKWNEADKYKGQSFNTISLKLVDGKTYSGVVSQAEGFLKAENERHIATLTKEIDSLEKMQSENTALKQKLGSRFKLEPLELKKDDFFGKQVPELVVNYTYIGKQPIKGEFFASIALYKIGTEKPVIAHGIGQSDPTDILKPDDSLNDNLILDDLAAEDPAKWNALKYPITNPDLKSLGLRLEVYPSKMTVNGKTVSFDKDLEADVAKQIKDKKEELKGTQESKGTLDELELTDNK